MSEMWVDLSRNHDLNVVVKTRDRLPIEIYCIIKDVKKKSTAILFAFYVPMAL